MKHYVCAGGCGTENTNHGMCMAEGCSKEDQPLVVCSCDDGSHDTRHYEHASIEGNNEASSTLLEDEY